jgi:hypothetical protein
MATWSVLSHAIVEVKQHWSVIGCMNKNVLPRTTPCFMLLIPVTFALVSTHQSTLSTRGGL